MVNLEIGDEKVEWYEGGMRQFIESKFLYTLSGQNTSYGDVDYNVYIGLNRVVAGNYRNGFGLCKATITLLEEGGRNTIFIVYLFKNGIIERSHDWSLVDFYHAKGDFSSQHSSKTYLFPM